ncbi:pol polyprotein [Lasius niger]|uniref:Pol polyprotein n=1 Tax=Lasius niger TaxID=67767 RepID=A0A0J7KIB8_LASNI|nr:pol polyprotein [Lasius niger]
MPVVISTEELYEEQRKDEELKAPIKKGTTLSLKKLSLDNGDKTIYYDVSDQIRIYVPATLRKRIVNTTHNLSHSSTRATKKMIAQRFVWPNMQKDVNKWVKTCLPCQRSKIRRHNVRIPEHIQVPSDCFHHVYMDIVGPLLASVGYRYCLTTEQRDCQRQRK